MGDINQDPSMEEILASIKRVIADDKGPPAAPRQVRSSRRTEPEAPPAPVEDDVLELNDPVTDANGLISDDAATASRNALAALAIMRRGEEAETRASDAPLEALVKDMLRPMLKDWLDKHLPEIVEDLVTREIARISGKQI